MHVKFVDGIMRSKGKFGCTLMFTAMNRTTADIAMHAPVLKMQDI